MSDEFDPEVIAATERRPETAASTAAAAARQLVEARRRAYARVFGNVDADAVSIVMADLARFCRGGMSAFDADERIHCLLSGRQEVYMRIKDHTTLTLDELVERLT